jgi:hypothetical protein
MAEQTIYGEYNADGSVKSDPMVCVVTGANLRGVHSKRVRISGTRYFYRVAVSAAHRLTDESKVALANGTPKAPTARKTKTESEDVNNG